MKKENIKMEFKEKLIERYTTQGTLNRKYRNRNKSNSNKKIIREKTGNQKKIKMKID